MAYYRDSVKLLKHYSQTKNLNYLRHFFSQLSQIREIFPIAIINAITATASEGVEDLIYNSVTIEPWMKRITLKDIRNFIVFTVFKDFRKVIQQEPYISADNTDAVMLSCDTEPVVGPYIEKLSRLIETVYYIHHVYVIKYQPEHIKEETWFMCHEFLNKVNLITSTHFIFTLLRRIITS